MMNGIRNNNTYSSGAASKQKEVFDRSLMKERSLSVETALFSLKQQSFAANAASSPGLDDSSVSSMGSCTSGLQSSIGSTSVRRRSLFSKYWVTTGESPVASAASAASTSRTSGPPTAIIEIADDQISQEESRNGDPIQQSSASPVRRSLFSQEARRSVSLDYLMQAAGEDRHHRETASSNSSLLSSKDGSPLRHKSEGELAFSSTKRRSSSCLRESRFSFSKQSCSSERSTASNSNSSKRSSSICSESSSSFVQFDMESNEVRHFLKPTEVHAEEGWTNYFN